jgi:hypothetical protein
MPKSRTSHADRDDRQVHNDVVDSPQQIRRTMYVLTGSTGGLCSQVLKSLLKLVPTDQVIVSLYNPKSDAAEATRSLGVTVRHGDYITRNPIPSEVGLQAERSY